MRFREITFFEDFFKKNTSEGSILRPPFYTFSIAGKVYSRVATALWRFQSSFWEALPERNRKEVESSAQRHSEDAQRTLRGRSEDVQMADWQRCTSNTEVDCHTE